MRRALAVALLALVLLATVPGTQAAINKPRPFAASFAYMAGMGDPGAFTVVSGDVEADLAPAPGSFGFFDSDGFTISGLQQVCYTTCQASTSGGLSLHVAAAAQPSGQRYGGSAALCFPTPPGGELEAGHVLGMFIDLAQDEDLNSFPVDKALVAPAIDGEFTFRAIAPIAAAPTPITQPCTLHGGLTALDEGTTIQVFDGTRLLDTRSGKSARFSFAGQPAVTPVAAGFYILPFNGGSEARFTPTSASQAEAGLDLDRVSNLQQRVQDADAQDSAPDQPTDTPAGDNSQEFLAGLLNGALLRLPERPGEGANISFADAHFVRFSRLGVSGASGDLAWDGKAYLEIEDGKVVGGRPLLGFWVFQLPWWSYLLWAVAIGLAITRLMLKPDKNHPRWDALRWVGWVATAVAWVLVFFLWDLEMRAVLGASLLRGSSGQFRLIVGLLQVGLLALVAFAAAAPLKVIGRNSFLLARQGTFMGLSGSIAAILGFLFGAPYLRAYLGLILDKVMQRLA